MSENSLKKNKIQHLSMQQQIQNVVNLPIYIDQLIDSSITFSTSICLLVLRPAVTQGNSSSHPHKIGVL